VIVFFLFFLVCVFVQAFYAGFINSGRGALREFGVLAFEHRKRVSVIICARNEAENLENNLPFVLSQEYAGPDGRLLYEVIVVDDSSIDNTQAVLQSLKQQYPHLRIISADCSERQGKKNALRQGVASANSDWLLLTDADCMPAGNRWLQIMVAPLVIGKEIVAGYGGYYRSPGILNAFIRWETLHTWMQYLTYTGCRWPYMAVGRNLACARAALMRAMQDPLWSVLPSGDDDLFVRIAGTADNMMIVACDEAFTWSPAKATWSEWARQKQRHLSTGKYYKPGIKLALGLYGITHAGMWLTFAMCLFSPYWQPALVFMLVRCLYQWIKWYIGAGKTENADLFYFFPLFDFGWMIYNFAFLPYITWKNKKNWK